MKGVRGGFARPAVMVLRRPWHRPAGRARRALWLGLGAAVLLTVIAQLAMTIGPHVNDMARLLAGAQALLAGRPPGPVLAAYPPSSVVQYVPLALLPGDVAELLTRVASAVILVWAVFTFGRGERGRVEPWAFVLLLSPPAISLVRLNQFNTALALLALILAWRLLQSGRPLLAGLVGGIAMTRPFNAVPAAAGMAGTTGGRTALRLVLGGLASFGATLVVAFVWDHNLIHDIIQTGAQRPLVGLAGTIRSNFGLAGVCVMLATAALLCWVLAAERRDRPLDAFLIGLAVSSLVVHVGGPYVAVFALPGLARLAASASPWWAVGTTVAYAALQAAVPLTSGLAMHDGIAIAFTLAPLAVTLMPLALRYTSRGRAGLAPAHASHLGAAAKSGDVAAALAGAA